MSRLSLAGALVIISAIICFFITRALLINEDFIGSVYETALPRSIAGLIPGGIVYIHQLFMRRTSKLSFTALPGKVASFEEYTLPWYRMVVYGVFLLYAISGISTIIIWLLGEVTGFYFSSVITPLNLVSISIGAYLIGFWVGTRCDTRKFLTVFAIMFFFSLAVMITTFFFESSFSVSSFLLFTGSTFFYFILAFVGLWRGNRLQWARYLHYLIQFVRPATHAALLHQTYEEVKRLSPEHPSEPHPRLAETR